MINGIIFKIAAEIAAIEVEEKNFCEYFDCRIENITSTQINFSNIKDFLLKNIQENTISKLGCEGLF